MSAGRTRWRCTSCGASPVRRIDSATKLLEAFLGWLLTRRRQADMPGAGRTFRRKTARFWETWPMPPKVEAPRRVVYVDGIHLGRRAVVLIASDDRHALGWHLCRPENSRASRRPGVVVSDGGDGLARALLSITTIKEADGWVQGLLAWSERWDALLSETTVGEDGKPRLTHERLVKARRSLVRLVGAGTLFTYLDPGLAAEGPLPATNNRIEGGVNSRLRAMLRDHRGLSIERRLKAIF